MPRGRSKSQPPKKEIDDEKSDQWPSPDSTKRRRAKSLSSDRERESMNSLAHTRTPPRRLRVSSSAVNREAQTSEQIPEPLVANDKEEAGATTTPVKSKTDKVMDKPTAKGTSTPKKHTTPAKENKVTSQPRPTATSAKRAKKTSKPHPKESPSSSDKTDMQVDNPPSDKKSTKDNDNDVPMTGVSPSKKPRLSAKIDTVGDQPSPSNNSLDVDPPQVSNVLATTKQSTTPSNTLVATPSKKPRLGTKIDTTDDDPLSPTKNSSHVDPPLPRKKPTTTPNNHKKRDGKKPNSSQTTTAHSPTVNVKVHRVRHLDYIPSAVLSMASSDSHLAVSRQDGSIELYHTTSIPEYIHSKKFTSHLFPLATVAGSKQAIAHSLLWVDKVLVAASPDGTLWTIPFVGRTRQLEARISSGGGGVFDLATCSDLPVVPLVAAACQDGSVRFWQILDGKIQEPPLATLSTAGAPLLSIAWRCVQQLKDYTYKTQVYVGVADGTIRKYHFDFKIDGDTVQIGRHFADLRMTVESRGRRTPTKVWTMQALEDGTLATGNSLGQIQLWDTVTGTLVQSFQQSEQGADVLKLVVNPSQTKLFASGVDSRVVCLERTNPTDTIWKFTTAHRPHTHDVKCMAIVQGYARDNKQPLDILVTAGIDTKLCTYVAAEFAKRRPQVYYPWPSQSPVSSSAGGTGQRVLSIHRGNQIELYRLDARLPSKQSQKSTSELIGEIALETPSNLAFSSMSPNGQWIAAANATQLFLFRLHHTSTNNNEEYDLEPQKLSLPKPLDRITVVALHFSGNLLFVADSMNRVYVVALSETVSIVSTVTLPHATELPISSLRTSRSGKFLGVMTKSSMNGVQVFQRGDDGTYGFYWSVPDLSGARPAAIAIIKENQLAIATVSFHVYVFDLEQCKLTPWSQANKFPIERWPMEISNRKDFPVRLFTNPKNESQLIMSSFGAFVVLNLDGQLPKHCRVVPETHVRSRRKRTREEEEPSSIQGRTNAMIFVSPEQKSQNRPHHVNNDPNARNCTVCLNYNSMLHLDFLGGDEMLVVEQPWLRVIATFPEALQRRVYGCN